MKMKCEKEIMFIEGMENDQSDYKSGRVSEGEKEFIALTDMISFLKNEQAVDTDSLLYYNVSFFSTESFHPKSGMIEVKRYYPQLEPWQKKVVFDAMKNFRYGGNNDNGRLL